MKTGRTPLPTAPSSVVWHAGHSFVLEGPGLLGGPLWVGLDGRGRPAAMSAAVLATLPWTLTPLTPLTPLIPLAGSARR